MECPSCRRECADGAKFCAECGARLPASCAACGATSSPDSKYCVKCGQSLSVGAPPSLATVEGTSLPSTRETSSATRRDSAGERRHLTVMFCDLVGSTALSESLDPEDMGALLRRFQNVCVAVITRFGGYVSQYLGDGLLVYFGYPQAHEDDAQRALRAAVRIVQDVPRVTAEIEGRHVGISVRIGVHSGVVVVENVGVGPRLEQLALGKTPNVAARMKDLAAPNHIVVSEETYRLVAGHFTWEDLGPQLIKGVSGPTQVYGLIGETDQPSRGKPVAPQTRLVGREQELAILRERWELVREGYGQTILLGGEAGIGKSRLVRALKEELVDEPHGLWDARCSPFHQDSPLFPILEVIERAFELRTDESAETRIDKLAAGLDRYGLADPEYLGLWSALLSLAPSRSFEVLSAPRRRQVTFDAILSLLCATAERQPLLFVIEDLHWADPTTLDLLEYVLDRAEGAAVLTVMTCRPGQSLALARHAKLTQLTLNRISRKQTQLMIDSLTEARPLPAEMLEQILRKTDGVPLFVEELIRMVLESGVLRDRDGRSEMAAPMAPLGIPSTLYDSLMARLDRLGSAKELAQLCSVIGRTFSYELLRLVSELDEASLQRDLTRLLEATLLHSKGAPPRATYTFRHALLQEAAYESLLKTRRQQYHLRVAKVLSEKFPETRETQPELFAHHLGQAGVYDEALRYYQAAGERALGRSATREAVAHLSKGLDLVRAGSGGPADELALQVTFAAALIAQRGYAAAQVEEAYTRARELCGRIGPTKQLYPVLRGLAAYYYVRGELHVALELGEQCLSLATADDSVALRTGAHLELGSTLLNLGRFADAAGHFEQGAELYDPEAKPTQAITYGQDLGVSCLSRLAVTLGCLGSLDQALEKSETALRLAYERAHPYSIAYAVSFAAVVRRLRRDVDATHELASTTIKLSVDHGFPFWTCVGNVLKGWALGERGEAAEGVALIRSAISSWQTMGARVSTTYFLAALGEACIRAGDTDGAMAAVDEAITLGQTTGDRWQEAVLYRIKGEQSRTSEDLARAVAIAREQQARTYELEALASLAGAEGALGHTGVREALGSLYTRFPEGRSTPLLTRVGAFLKEQPPR